MIGKKRMIKQYLFIPKITQQKVIKGKKKRLLNQVGKD